MSTSIFQGPYSKIQNDGEGNQSYVLYDLINLPLDEPESFTLSYSLIQDNMNVLTGPLKSQKSVARMAVVIWNAYTLGNRTVRCKLYKNGVLVQYFYSTAYASQWGTFDIYLKNVVMGDTISIKVYGSPYLKLRYIGLSTIPEKPVIKHPEGKILMLSRVECQLWTNLTWDTSGQGNPQTIESKIQFLSPFYSQEDPSYILPYYRETRCGILRVPLVQFADELYCIGGISVNSNGGITYRNSSQYWPYYNQDVYPMEFNFVPLYIG